MCPSHVGKEGHGEKIERKGLQDYTVQEAGFIHNTHKAKTTKARRKV